MSGGNYIGQVPANNFNPGRAGHAMIGIACHHTWTTVAGAVARFLDASQQVSAHEIVGRDGVPAFMLLPTDTAFADGLWEANLDYYAIEFEQSPTDVAFTPEQYAYGHQRALDLASQFGWTVSLSTIKPHSAFVATSCPGDFDIPELIGGSPLVATQTVTPAAPVPGVVYDTPNNDRSFLDYNTVAYVPGQIAAVGQNVSWTEAKYVSGKWLLHLSGTTWALWDDCVDDTDATHDAAHSSPPDFAPPPPPVVIPLPPPPPPPPAPPVVVPPVVVPPPAPVPDVDPAPAVTPVPGKGCLAALLGIR